MAVGLIPQDRESHLIFDYCVTELWSGFRPRTDYAVEFARSWFPRAAGSPVVMASILFSASVHRYVRLPPSSPGQDKVLARHLQLKGTAIRTIRDAISDSSGLSGEKIDELVFAILCLAVNQHAAIVKPKAPEKTNFVSPLVGAQWLDLYANMDFDPTHFGAIVALIGRKGGIQTMQAYGVGWLVHL